jgi:hypothetical protein
MSEWSPIVLICVTLFLFYMVSKLFGGHLRHFFLAGAKLEFKTRMGMISLIGFLGMFFLYIDKSISKYVISIFSSEKVPYVHDDVLIWGVIGVIIANYVLIGILSRS